jgi:uncharacterized membrane protein
MNTLSVGDMVRFGWETFKKRPWFFIGVTAVTVVIGWAIGFVSGIADNLVSSASSQNAGAFVGFVVSFPLQVLLGMGVVSLYLKAHENPETAEISDLWHPHNFLNYLVANIILGVVVIVGFVLLIVPGIILALTLQFATYLVVDRGLGPIEALKESARITKGNRWNLFALALAVILISLLGLVALVVGLLVAIPVVSLTIVHAYRTLEHTSSEVAAM